MANLAQVANTIHQNLFFEADAVTERAAVGAGRREVVGQEALTAQRGRIIASFRAFAVQNVDFLGQCLPSTIDDARIQFAKIFPSLIESFERQQNEDADSILLSLESDENLTLLHQYRSLRTDVARTVFHATNPEFRAFYSAVLAREQRFRLKAAWMGARLVNQDPEAPHYGASSREAYSALPRRHAEYASTLGFFPQRDEFTRVDSKICSKLGGK